MFLAPSAQTGSAGGLPTTLFFNTDGKLAERHVGGIAAKELADKIDAMRNANWIMDLAMRLIHYVPVESDSMAQ